MFTINYKNSYINKQTKVNDKKLKHFTMENQLNTKETRQGMRWKKL